MAIITMFKKGNESNESNFKKRLESLNWITSNSKTPIDFIYVGEEHEAEYLDIQRILENAPVNSQIMSGRIPENKVMSLLNDKIRKGSRINTFILREDIHNEMDNEFVLATNDIVKHHLRIRKQVREDSKRKKNPEKGILRRLISITAGILKLIIQGKASPSTLEWLEGHLPVLLNGKKDVSITIVTK